MKRVILILGLTAFAACATDQAFQKEENQAVMDFIEVRGLQELDKLATSGRDGWEEISLSYLIYKSRREQYLIEFSRPCYELRDKTTITPDVRADPNYIRARFDTLRGCRISKIYALTEAEAEELSDIGEAPGSRN